ncbi:MAG TPA: hypothetical protein VIL00_15150 [Pseudonocardiaceae bacterium]
MTRVVLAVDAEVQPARLRQLTSTLYEDLRELPEVDVVLVDDDNPDPDEPGVETYLAELVVRGTFTTATVTALVEAITGYLGRTAARSVTWYEGERSVVFTGREQQDRDALAAVLEGRPDAA